MNGDSIENERPGAGEAEAFCECDAIDNPMSQLAQGDVFEWVQVSDDSGEADRTFGPQVAVDLTVVHRFSPEILDLIRHINHRYPALDLGRGGDWKLELDGVTSSMIPGKRPVVVRYMTPELETRGALRRAESLWQAHKGSTAALLVIDKADPILSTSLWRLGAAVRSARDL